MALFELYKPTQGKYVRWGTVAFAGVIVALGMWWMAKDVMVGVPTWQQALGVCIFGAVGAIAIFYAVNHPRTAEFMIMTESEMRKVNWPTRTVVLNSTKVVILLTVVMAVILGLLDAGFIKLFQWMGIG